MVELVRCLDERVRRLTLSASVQAPAAAFLTGDSDMVGSRVASMRS